ncbi:hypothetical protein [Actinoplanes sp. NPDC049118]|uniref:hypothetical protein n=1 Tax=Actinoplanes sp. NPDC049118 TaxID=3155769 RepID=UPI0033F5FD97
MLASASTFVARVRLADGDVGECHGNVAALWIDGALASIGTGYALSEDQLWRQHSWGVDTDGALVETTEERRAYVGIVLSERTASIQFAGSNAQEHLKRSYGNAAPAPQSSSP